MSLIYVGGTNMKHQEMTKENQKSTVITIAGVIVMMALTLTKIIPSSTVAGYSVFVGIAFFFITEAAAKTQRSDSGLRFDTIPADLKKPGVIPWALLPSVSGVVCLFVGDLIFSGGFSAHIMGRTGTVGLTFSNILLMLGQIIIAAFGEEIAYRGFFFGKTAKRFPVWLCAVVSSAVFAAGHIAVGSLPLVAYDVVTVFLDSLLFTMVYHKTGNCVISTFSHILANSVSIAVALVLF